MMCFKYRARLFTSNAWSNSEFKTLNTDSYRIWFFEFNDISTGVAGYNYYVSYEDYTLYEVSSRGRARSKRAKLRKSIKSVSEDIKHATNYGEFKLTRRPEFVDSIEKLHGTGTEPNFTKIFVKLLGG